MCQKVAKDLIEVHQKQLNEGSWAAYFEANKHIQVVDQFYATGQFSQEVNHFWLWVENDRKAWEDFEKEIGLIKQVRKTTKGQLRLAMDRAKSFRRRHAKRYNALCKECEEEYQWSTNFEGIFSRVFAAAALDNPKGFDVNAELILYPNTPSFELKYLQGLSIEK